MFSLDKTKVVLIQKNRPEWQKGKLNGVGGKKEKTDFNLFSTMIRKFKEETGVDTRPKQKHNHLYNHGI